MVETGTGEEKRKGSASTPCEVPSNFSPVVTPVAEVPTAPICLMYSKSRLTANNFFHAS